MLLSHVVTKSFSQDQWTALQEVVQATDALDEARFAQRQAIAAARELGLPLRRIAAEAL